MTLEKCAAEKKNLGRVIKDLELEFFEQGKTLDKVVGNEDHHQNKIKYLMEDLRMIRDKNSKLEAAFEKDKETKQNQIIKMHEIAEKNQKYKSQLQKLKEQKNN